jgi:PRTRC genetic system ThiF family protein
MKPQTIDTSFARAASMLLASHRETRILLVGCGGTGSWLAPAVARLARVMIEAGRDVRVTFIDHDSVEAGNIPRQSFCFAEISQNKAIALASRYGAAWGLEIAAVPQPFTPKLVRADYDTLTLMLGCVDNAAARKAMHEALKMNRADAVHRVWWLDCGNYADGGQVLLGSAHSAAHLEGAFKSARVCTALPSPALINPDLLKARPEETGKRMGCAELIAANMQSLTVNQHVAAVAADYLTRLLTGGQLKIFATDFNQAAQSSRSRAITPEEVAAVVRKPVEFVLVKAKGAGR